MRLKPVALPSDLAAAHAMIMAERAARVKAEARATAVCSERDEARAEAANAQADLSSQEALIAHLKLAIEKLRRAIYGSRSERQVRLLDQLELQLEELEAAATEDQLAAEAAAAQTQTVRSFQRKRPVRKPFPADIERERVVIEAPTSCACCGGSRLAKLGEDITETLEEIPRRFKVIETVREKFTCRDCEAITQPPAPFHATPARLHRAAASRRRSCSTSSAYTYRSTVRAGASNAKASICRSRRWPTRSAPASLPRCRCSG